VNTRPITALAALMLVCSGCASIEHATKTARETACTDNWGRAIPVNQRTQQNCPLGTAREFWGPAQASDIAIHSQTVLTPNGSYQINQLGTITSIHRTSRGAR